MIPTGVSMVVSGGAVSPENRSNEEKVAALARWLDFQFESPAIGNQVRAIGAALAAVERERDSLADLADELQEQDERNLAEMSAENARLLARIAAVEADRHMYAASLDSMTMRLVRLVEAAHLTPTSDDGEGMEGALKHFIRAVLAASPTPTTEEQA